MDWLIRQLFGAHATDHLLDKIRAAIGSYLVAHPDASASVVTAWATTQADNFVNQVLVHFPGWAAAALLSLLNQQIGRLIASAYASVQASGGIAASAAV